MLHEYEYKNEKYKSKVNDYNDDYHKYDEEAESNELLKKVKMCKRRYRDFGEYCDACDIINDYMEYLVDKWGGEKRFAFFLKVGLMTDYLPGKPKLKKTRYNYKYMKEGVDRIETEHFNNVIGKPLPEEAKKLKFKFKFKESKDDIFTSKYISSVVRENLGLGIDDIKKYYAINANKPVNLSKKLLKKEIRKKDILDNDEPTMEEVEKEYYRRIDARDFDYDDPDQLYSYKGALLRKDDIGEVEAMELMRAAGLRVTTRVLSKKSRSIVKKKKKEKKKEKKLKDEKKKLKKKEKKMQENILSNFRRSTYETFDEFTSEIMTVVGSDCGRYK